MEKAFQTICALVKDFKANEKAYLSQSYQESQVRQDFIDKFFTALGWDVTHTVQKNPYEQEVKIENKVTTQGSQRRADYAFFVTPNYRDVKFFAEAKKPAHNLSNPDYYHQTIRYGWNAGTPIALLTDFEEFHVLDCRYKPDIGDALNRKLKYFHYSEYTNEEKFKEIFYLFGREAVANGSLEKFAANLPKPRGKAIQVGLFKGGYKSVDEDFLELLDEYRNVLAKAFKKENQELDGEELTEAVQRTIDRLVFIRFLEDKGIEEPEIIGLHEKPSAWKGFIALCKRLEPKYNGLIFKPHRILDGKDFQAPDDTAFADICAELSDPSSPYDFDKIPISILGSIYERFLGKVVHSTDKRVKVEEKPEVRKAGGVYYTPEYIVRYIVNETVGKLLMTPTQSPPIRGRSSEGTEGVITQPYEGNKEETHINVSHLKASSPSQGSLGKTPDEIVKMSFADIACGSGSFLIEVYSQLLEYHERWYNAYPDKAKKEDVFERDGHLQLTLKKKKEILLNNVYGVDIDFQATEVTQLSLYLKLLENVTSYETHQLGMFKEQILPNLNSNIVCGNSLIGTDINGLGLEKEQDKLKPMNFEDVFPQIMKRGGFDVVVGNPPYVRIQGLQEDNNQIEYIKKKYVSASVGNFDLYTTFLEKALTTLRREGKLGYIVPHKFFNSNYGRPIRGLLAKGNYVSQVVHFGDNQVFRGATTYTALVFLEKGGSKSINVTKVDDIENWIAGARTNYGVINSNDLTDQEWSFTIGNSVSLLKRLEAFPTKLENFATRIFQGLKTGADPVFILEKHSGKGFYSNALDSTIEIETKYLRPFSSRVK
jgi:adenine-specific DNA-methyltransferase